MKMSAIEEIGPIGVQVGRQAAPGEIAEINNNYKRAKHNLQSTTLIFIVIVSMTYVCQHYMVTIAKDENTILTKYFLKLK